MIKSEIISKLDLEIMKYCLKLYQNQRINISLNLYLKFDKRKHRNEKWINNNLLSLVNQKHDMYRNWKSTNNVNKYTKKKKNANF